MQVEQLMFLFADREVIFSMSTAIVDDCTNNLQGSCVDLLLVFLVFKLFQTLEIEESRLEVALVISDCCRLRLLFLPRLQHQKQ